MRVLLCLAMFATAFGQLTDCGNSFKLNMTIRDFAAAKSEWAGQAGKDRHPDFEIPNAFFFNTATWNPKYDNLGTKNMAQNQLVNGRMVYNSTTACPSGGMPWGTGTNTRCAPSSQPDMVTSATTFDQWYKDGSEVLGTYTFTIDMNLMPSTNPPKYNFSSPKFFPLDNNGPRTGKIKNGDGDFHNYGFTTEIHADFTMESGAELSFEGDDDVWIFIDGTLVLDLGGMHDKIQQTVKLNDVTLNNGRKLVNGARYSMVMFHAERHTDASNFAFQSLCLTSKAFIATDEPTAAPTIATSEPTSVPTRQPTDQPSVAPTFGDPHLVTLDGLRYTFNGVGDYYLSKSDADDVVVQMRTHVVSNTSAAVTGVAMRYGETSVAAVWSGKNSEEIRLTINGRLIGNDKPSFEDAAVLARLNGDSYEVTLRGLELKMHLFYDGRSSFQIEMPPVMRGRVRGLLGNFNGEPRDDLMSAGGVRVPIVASNRRIHYAFGRTWEVPPRLSLFRTFDRVHHVPYGEQFESTFEPLFETSFKDREFESKARAVCGDDAQCLYDAAATNDLQYAALTKLDNARGVASRVGSLLDAGSTVQGAYKLDL